MPSDDLAPFDAGLLSPVTAGRDAVVSDDAVVDALVTAEVALVRALAAEGAIDPSIAERVSGALGWQAEGDGCRGHGVSARDLSAAAVSDGNPVIPLVAGLRDAVAAEDAPWIHRGATSQDILDTALMIVARSAADAIGADLTTAADALVAFAGAHADDVAAARTLTQHAVPTTVGARAAGWERGIRRSLARLVAARDALPAQLGGAAGTLASFVEGFGPHVALRLPGTFAAQVGLRAPAAPWHTERWPVTELGDALVQVTDALGKMAADVATLSRTEIGELAEGTGGGSSAMPQKQNPVRAVLIRSAAIRAPQLGATLHFAAALAVDERPDGAWHAEWPALRELLRVTLGAAAHAADLARGLRVDRDAVARNLALTGGLLVSERLRAVLVPLVGPERFAHALAGSPETLAERIRALPEAAHLDLDDLLDPARYTGLAPRVASDPDPAVGS
ncbi:lyase family protein [Microbacterium sp. NPDC057407]|uniref:lyase family protein n=1 Tax=Microbacterium sp. NPDC057407 TaxID=3346120 RepID=UPI00366BD540